MSLAEHVKIARDRVVADPEATRLLSERLLAAGYLDDHSDRYVVKCVLSDVLILQIDGMFPRLFRGNVPPGIQRASYEIDLDQVIASRLPMSEMLTKLGVL